MKTRLFALLVTSFLLLPELARGQAGPPATARPQPMSGGGGAFAGGAGFGGGFGGAVPPQHMAGWLFRPANPEQMYEDIEILRRLLTDKLQSHYRSSQRVT